MPSTLNLDFLVRPTGMEIPVREAIGLIFEELENRYGPRDTRLRLAHVWFVPVDSQSGPPQMNYQSFSIRDICERSR